MDSVGVRLFDRATVGGWSRSIVGGRRDMILEDEIVKSDGLLGDVEALRLESPDFASDGVGIADGSISSTS